MQMIDVWFNTRYILLLGPSNYNLLQNNYSQKDDILPSFFVFEFYGFYADRQPRHRNAMSIRYKYQATCMDYSVYPHQRAWYRIAIPDIHGFYSWFMPSSILGALTP
jgi:hypothetical protein